MSEPSRGRPRTVNDDEKIEQPGSVTTPPSSRGFGFRKQSSESRAASTDQAQRTSAAGMAGPGTVAQFGKPIVSLLLALCGALVLGAGLWTGDTSLPRALRIPISWAFTSPSTWFAVSFGAGWFANRAWLSALSGFLSGLVGYGVYFFLTFASGISPSSSLTAALSANGRLILMVAVTGAVGGLLASLIRHGDRKVSTGCGVVAAGWLFLGVPLSVIENSGWGIWIVWPVALTAAVCGLVWLLRARLNSRLVLAGGVLTGLLFTLFLALIS